MHAQARRGVDFDDAASLFLERLEHGLAHRIDACDVQADHLRGGDRARGDVRVDVIGHVGGAAAGRQVRVIAQDYARALGRHGLCRQALLGQRGERDVVKADLGQRGCVAFATARVAVHFLDQLAHGMRAIADHLRRVAARGGDEVLADHQQTEVVARNIALDDHIRTDVRGNFVSCHHLLARADAHGHALALVAVARLHDHGRGDFLRGFPRLLGAAHRTAERHRHAGRMQQALGQVLVLRDRFGHGAGRTGLGGLDAALLAAPAELHHRTLREAPVRNAARDGRVDDGAGAGPKAHVSRVRAGGAVRRRGRTARRRAQPGTASGPGRTPGGRLLPRCTARSPGRCRARRSVPCG